MDFEINKRARKNMQYWIVAGFLTIVGVAGVLTFRIANIRNFFDQNRNIGVEEKLVMEASKEGKYLIVKKGSRVVFERGVETGSIEYDEEKEVVKIVEYKGGLPIVEIKKYDSGFEEFVLINNKFRKDFEEVKIVYENMGEEYRNSDYFRVKGNIEKILAGENILMF